MLFSSAMLKPVSFHSWYTHVFAGIVSFLRKNGRPKVNKQQKVIYLWLFIPVFWYLLSYDVLAPLIQRMRAILWINPAERIELSRW